MTAAAGRGPGCVLVAPCRPWHGGRGGGGGGGGWTPAGLGLQMTLWVRVSRSAQPRTEMLEGQGVGTWSMAPLVQVQES